MNNDATPTNENTTEHHCGDSTCTEQHSGPSNAALTFKILSVGIYLSILWFMVHAAAEQVDNLREFVTVTAIAMLVATFVVWGSSLPKNDR